VRRRVRRPEKSARWPAAPIQGWSAAALTLIVLIDSPGPAGRPGAPRGPSSAWSPSPWRWPCCATRREASPAARVPAGHHYV